MGNLCSQPIDAPAGNTKSADAKPADEKAQGDNPELDARKGNERGLLVDPCMYSLVQYCASTLDNAIQELMVTLAELKNAGADCRKGLADAVNSFGMLFHKFDELLTKVHLVSVQMEVVIGQLKCAQREPPEQQLLLAQRVATDMGQVSKIEAEDVGGLLALIQDLQRDVDQLGKKNSKTLRQTNALAAAIDVFAFCIPAVCLCYRPQVLPEEVLLQMLLTSTLAIPGDLEKVLKDCKTRALFVDLLQCDSSMLVRELATLESQRVELAATEIKSMRKANTALTTTIRKYYDLSGKAFVSRLCGVD